MKWTRITLALGAAAAVLAACAETSVEVSGSLVCNAAYRVAQSEPLTDVDSLTFEDTNSVQSLPYIYLELHGEYRDGRVDGERVLRIWVTRTAEETPLVSHLYQLAENESPRNQFLGDHGFTGLHYAYDPVSGAELQYWCVAE